MPLPSNDIRAQLAKLRSEFAERAALNSEYEREMASKYIHEMIPFEDWLAMRNAQQGKANGGLAHMADGGQEDDYRSSHTAPGPDFGAPMHDVTRDMYPKDFYGPNGFRYYADFGEHHDRDAYNKVIRVKGKPDEMVYIHRAIPTSVYKEALKKEAPYKHMIRPGDWVAISKQYAKDHGESVLNGDYKVVSRRVPAKHVWTNGDSVHEWGYHPVETKASGGSIPSQDVMRLAIGGQGPKNWLKGSVESVVGPLLKKEFVGTKQYPVGPELDEAMRRRIAEMEAARGNVKIPSFIPTHDDHLREKLANPDVNGVAVNQWIQRNLANYIRKQMATHDDPIRKLAEQGIIHMPPEQMGYGSSQAEMVRKKHGAPRLGQSPEAQAWEDATDVAMHPHTIEEMQQGRKIGLPWVEHAFEPWMKDADPKTKIFRPTDNMHAHYLGFDHLVDILKEDLAQGRIRPEQLSKVSIEQAVRRAHEYDQERKKAMAETALKATEGMPVHKDYGNGFKWIELAKPKDLTELPQGHTAQPYKSQYSEGVKILNSKGEQVAAGDSLDEALKNMSETRLEEALKYEGDTMGHCVGGYCPDVIEGHSRIFSLRDAKNEPHVTIEVQPKKTAPRHEDVLAEMKKNFNLDLLPDEDYNISYEQTLNHLKNNPPLEIKQIKGKQNAKPKHDYIPYVQDFVKSGKWTDVGDLQNAEMHHAGNLYTNNERKNLERLTGENLEYVAQQDIPRHRELLKQHNVPLLLPDEKAHGGITHAHHLEIEERKL